LAGKIRKIIVKAKERMSGKKSKPEQVILGRKKIKSPFKNIERLPAQVIEDLVKGRKGTYHYGGVEIDYFIVKSPLGDYLDLTHYPHGRIKGNQTVGDSEYFEVKSRKRISSDEAYKRTRAMWIKKGIK